MVHALGAWGEEVAASHVASLGWDVLDRNWRCREGEIDLVATSAGPSPCLVVIEVKTRRGTGFGDPLEAITVEKLARLRRLAMAWVRAHPHPGMAVRVDAIGILKQPGFAPVIDHRVGVA